MAPKFMKCNRLLFIKDKNRPYVKKQNKKRNKKKRKMTND